MATSLGVRRKRLNPDATAFSESRELTDNDLLNAIEETVPLYDTYEERIKELRDWARTRARAASIDDRMVDLFDRT